MSEDRLLGDLAREVREARESEAARFDERWDRLAAGTLTAEEDAELRALAESSPEARATYEAFRPLGAEFQARMVALAATELGTQAREAEARPSRFRLLTFRKPATRLVGWLSAAGTAVAALFLVLLRGPAALPPLPLYTMTIPQGAQIVRGEPAEASGRPVFFPGSELTLTAQPAQAVEGPIEAHAFLGHDTELLSWEPPPPMRISAEGVVQVSGTLTEDIQLPPGAWTVWLVVGRPGRIPSASELAIEISAGHTQGESWQAVPADLQVEDNLPP